MSIQLRRRISIGLGISELVEGGTLGRLAWLGSTSAIGWILNLVSLIYLSRVLGHEMFGLLSFGISAAALAGVLVAPGLNLWGTRTIAQSPDRAGRVLVLVNGTQMGLAGVAYLVLCVVSLTTLQTSQRDIALAAGTSLFAVALSAQWAAQGLERFDLLGVAQATGAAAGLAAVVLLVHGPADVYRIPLLTSAAQISAAIALVFALHRLAGVRLDRLDVRSFRAMWTSVPLGIATVIITILHHANNIFIQIFRGSAELGLFAAGIRIVELLGVVASVITSLFLPRIARHIRDDPAAARRHMAWLVRLTMTGALLPGVLLVVDGDAVNQALYGADFRAAAPIVRAMGFGVVFDFAAIAYIMGLIAAGRDRAFLMSIIAAMAAAIGGGIFAVPRYGLAGATVVFLSLDVVTWLLTLPTIRRVFGDLFLTQWIRPLIVGGVTAGLLALLSVAGIPFLPRVAIASAVYLTLVLPWSLRTLSVLAAWRFS